MHNNREIFLNLQIFKIQYLLFKNSAKSTINRSKVFDRTKWKVYAFFLITKDKTKFMVVEQQSKNYGFFIEKNLYTKQGCRGADALK